MAMQAHLTMPPLSPAYLVKPAKGRVAIYDERTNSYTSRSVNEAAGERINVNERCDWEDQGPTQGDRGEYQVDHIGGDGRLISCYNEFYGNILEERFTSRLADGRFVRAIYVNDKLIHQETIELDTQ